MRETSKTLWFFQKEWMSIIWFTEFPDMTTASSLTSKRKNPSDETDSLDYSTKNKHSSSKGGSDFHLGTPPHEEDQGMSSIATLTAQSLLQTLALIINNYHRLRYLLEMVVMTICL